MLRRTLRRSVGAAVLAGAIALPGAQAQAESVLRVGMTAADIPINIGQPDQGFEGFRFMGYMLYDPLVLWDLSKADAPAGLTPGLAESWSVDPDNPERWIFKLRKGVKFHDGSDFTADDVVWNFEKVRNSDAPQYEPKQAALVAARIPALKAVNKIDDYTVEILTDGVSAYVPYQVSFWFMSSQEQWEKVGSWAEFAKAPSGTGPWKFVSQTPRAKVEMVPNKDYWNPARVPKVDRVILRPIPEASARVAALLSGQVDFIEAPPPDAIPRLKSSGMKIVTNAYPHNWAIKPSRIEGSPWNDINVRKAANLCIDRAGMTQMLGGLAIPSEGHLPPGDTWFGEPTFKLGYKPDEARKLMAASGHSADKPLTVKIAISTSGSGQMQPLPMFEFLQANLNECYFDVQAEVMEWNALTAFGRKPANSEEAVSKGVNAVVISHALQDPYSAFERFFLSSRISPAGSNWGMLVDPWYDETLAKAAKTFDVTAQTKILQSVHERVVDNAEWVWVVHDVNPRALAPYVKGFVQAKSWFQDLTPISLER
ncbi:MAG: ABC transporter substrate-binding protein [Alphaproteobacteria bacterium]|nr:ABC transporter substrate-binding protein [Alphaproteobacteria bacterium]MCB9928609.1 ABC transporter substrate-binding protein [Alphaproteobacteria bacterium]